MRRWVEIRDEMWRAAPASKWRRALIRARDRYQHGIREYRGVSRLRTMYRARRR